MASLDPGRLVQDLIAKYPNVPEGEIRAIDRRWRRIANQVKPGAKYI